MKPLLFAAAALAGALSVSSAAFAAGAECPADQVRANARTTGEMTPSKVTDNELEALALGGEIKGLDNRRLRLRRLVIQPGGVVPWHSHTDRPALLMTLSGEITEYRSSCAVGITHKAGDVTPEKKGVSHWWKNNGKVPAVIIAADIKNDGEPAAAADMM
ncbi:MAG: cupin domain-containing protein [Phenylobacterium sp.]|uniref:cupin domain-containing protein n=1 Tax=Phenylobacterium sp. TaxID=1871053 RepID=UPI0025E795B6|nr:cupin domain-containing protein [Phenylobacterium sp.]MBI1197999.1 cupin domain-containing protein [Phenylobacterium sp.]